MVALVMNDVVLYFYSFILITIYTICTLINLFCLSVMVFFVFDVWILNSSIKIYNKVIANRRRKKFKLVKGDKDE